MINIIFSLAAAQGKLKGQSRQDFNSVSQKIQQKYLYPLKLRTKYTVWHESFAGLIFTIFERSPKITHANENFPATILKLRSKYSLT